MASILMRADCLDYEKGCWRTFEAGADMDLIRFSYALLASFDADGSHMTEMRTKRERLVMFPEEEESGMLLIGRGLPEERFEVSLLEDTVLGEIAEAGEEITLLYDFSAGHAFRLTVLEKRPEGAGDAFRILDGEGRGILEETGPGEEAEAMRIRALGGECVLKDASGASWDPLDAGKGLDTADVLARAERMTADFYAAED